MNLSEEFLVKLAGQKEHLKNEVHQALATAASSYVREVWAGREDKPKELVAERLKVETDPQVLSALIEDLEADVVTTLIERGQTGVLIEEILRRRRHFKEDLILEAFKLAKQLDPTGYHEGLEKCSEVIGEAAFTLWSEASRPILLTIINDGPVSALEYLCNYIPPRYWDPAADALVNRITETLNPKSLYALGTLAQVKTFTSLKSTAQETIKNLLQTEPSKDFNENDRQALDALRWWAGLRDEPKNNRDAEELKRLGRVTDSTFSLAMDAPVEAAKAFIEGTKLASNIHVQAFTQWAYEHCGEVDYKVVAEWMQKLIQPNGTVLNALFAVGAVTDALFTIADDLVKLRPLMPSALQGNGALLLQKAKTLDEVKQFPLKEILAQERYSQEVFGLINSSDKSLEIFYALADTYEGTLAEFLEVINDFKAESA